MHLTQAFDIHIIMVLKTFSVLNTCVYRNIRVLKLICENERTISDTFSDKNIMYRFELPGLEKDRDNFLCSCTSQDFTDQSDQSELVLPLLKYMKLNSKSSLVISFICNSHSLCS